MKPPSRAALATGLLPKRPLPDDHPFRKMSLEERLANLEKGRKTAARRRAEGAYKKPTRAEARDKALRELEPKAIQVLRENLDSNDEKLRQRAAEKVLEWQWGKAATVIEKPEPETVEFSSSVLDALASDN